MICNPFIHFKSIFTECAKDQPALLEAFLQLEKEFNNLYSYINKIDFDDILNQINNLTSKVDNNTLEITDIINTTSIIQSKLSLIENDINVINGKIPTQASTTNQLADKNFVNSLIITKADKDGSNLSESDILSWKSIIGSTGDSSLYEFDLLNHTITDIFNFMTNNYDKIIGIRFKSLNNITISGNTLQYNLDNTHNIQTNSLLIMNKNYIYTSLMCTYDPLGIGGRIGFMYKINNNNPLLAHIIIQYTTSNIYFNIKSQDNAKILNSESALFEIRSYDQVALTGTDLTTKFSILKFIIKE